MEYTVSQLARLSGVTARTLRWYDRAGLLKPARLTDAGYRIYGPEQVDRLQAILFYRELGFQLADIRAMLDAPRLRPAGGAAEPPVGPGGAARPAGRPHPDGHQNHRRGERRTTHVRQREI